MNHSIVHTRFVRLVHFKSILQDAEKRSLFIEGDFCDCVGEFCEQEDGKDLLSCGRLLRTFSLQSY